MSPMLEAMGIVMDRIHKASFFNGGNLVILRMGIIDGEFFVDYRSQSDTEYVTRVEKEYIG